MGEGMGGGEKIKDPPPLDPALYGAGFLPPARGGEIFI